jgi:3-oxoacyl-[acyl-carrier protein] reductase
MIDLTGKVALVTGASRGIGLATAQKLAQCGARVMLCARSVEAIQRHVVALSAAGAQVAAIQCDVSRNDDVETAVARTVSTFGRLDILVNNAGSIDPIARITDSDVDLWSNAIDINVKGVYYGLRAAIAVMEPQGSGTIINISSGAANSALEGWSHYCASKIAAKKLTECAHKEYGHLGICIVGLSPGTVTGAMMNKVKASGINPVSQLDASAHIPPEWAAEAVAWLCINGTEYSGTDFSIKTPEGRMLVGLDQDELAS